MKVIKKQPVQQHPQLQKLDRKLKQAAQMYEKQFLRQMVKAMRKSVSHSALTKPGMAENIYREQLDDKYVDGWMNSGGTGFADMIYDDLVSKFFPQLGSQKPKVIRPVGLSDRFRGMKPKASVSNQKSRDFEIDLVAANKKQSYLKLPWSGKVTNFFNLNDQETVAQVEHDSGLVSTFAFKGRVEPGLLNESLKAGEDFAQLSPLAQKVSWKLQVDDSRKDPSNKDNGSFN